jgi:hypothetical protein
MSTASIETTDVSQLPPVAEGPTEDVATVRDMSFLGEEFLTWLAFRLDTQGGHFALKDAGDVDVWIDERILLKERGIENGSETSIKGGDPARAPETYAALGNGKALTRARMGIRRGQDREWMFTLDNQLLMRSLKLPTLMNDEEDEKLFERLALLEEIAFIFDELFGEFCEARFGDLWERSVLPAMRRWVRGEERPPSA